MAEAKSKRHNIIIFGESGAGKSSIVNLLVGENVAEVSSSPRGCTFQSDRYEANIGNDNYIIYDTVGLNEGDQGRFPHWTAIQRLYTLIRELDSVSLLLYCMRGRSKENTRANWVLFNKIICGQNVPIVVVETGLEQEENLQGAARRRELVGALRDYEMFPHDAICIVSIQGKHGEYKEVYQWSQQQLRKLIARSRKNKPWSTDKDVWLAKIYQEVYTTGNCFRPGTRLEFSQAVGSAVDEFITATRMNAQDSERLKASLLYAEKKFRKKFKHRISRGT